jgi:hypothetical protein
MSTRSFIVIVFLLLSSLAAWAQQPPTPLRPRTVEVPFTVISAKQVRFAQPLQIGGPRLSKAEQRLDSAYMVRVEVPAASYDALPPSIEPYLYIGGRELRTFSIDRPPGGKTLLVTYFAPGDTRAAAFEIGAPMVITIEHGRPTREPGRYRSRSDLKTFRSEWLRNR